MKYMNDFFNKIEVLIFNGFQNGALNFFDPINLVSSKRIVMQKIF